MKQPPVFQYRGLTSLEINTQMRDFIDIIEEAAKSHDLGVLKIEVAELAKVLRREPFGIVFDRKLADILIAKMKQYKIQAEDEEDSYRVTDEDALEYVLQRHWKGSFHLSFFRVRKEIEDATHDYQMRAADRHGWNEDDLQMIESSNWLSCMNAQEKCATTIDICLRNLADRENIAKIVKAIKDFVG